MAAPPPPSTYTAISITLGVAALALVLRFCARRMQKKRLCSPAYDADIKIFATCYCVAILIWTVKYRFGQKIGFYSDEKAAHIRDRSLFILWIGGIAYASSVAFSKLSILSFYWRLFQFTSVRYPIIILLTASTVWYIVRTFMIIFQCIPVRAYWDKTVEHPKCRINGAKFFYGTIITHSVMDLIIITLPIIEVTRMHLPLGQKLAVVALFISGGLVFGASIIVVVQSFRFDPTSTELPYDVAWNVLVSSVEVNLAVISGCLPILRPIFRKFLPGLSTGASTHHVPLPSVVAPPHELAKYNAQENTEGVVRSNSPSLTDDIPDYHDNLRRYHGSQGNVGLSQGSVSQVA